MCIFCGWWLLLLILERLAPPVKYINNISKKIKAPNNNFTILSLQALDGGGVLFPHQ